MNDPSMLNCDHWTHKNKGGQYEVEMMCPGDGELNGEMLVIYSKSVGKYETFARKLSEWDEKMEPVYEDDD